MSDSEIDNLGGYRIWDTGLFGRDVEEVVNAIITMGLLILIVKFVFYF